MKRYVALLRAVNVGGTGKLPMSELTAMCSAEGWHSAKTYIASGNVVFSAVVSEADVKRALETRLQAYAGKPVGVIIRTASAMADALARNPFNDTNPSRTIIIFLDEPAPADTLAALKGLDDEEVHLSGREIYIHFPRGQADTKLVIPAAKAGTGRNLNTARKLAEMATKPV